MICHVQQMAQELTDGESRFIGLVVIAWREKGRND